MRAGAAGGGGRCFRRPFPPPERLTPSRGALPAEQANDFKMRRYVAHNNRVMGGAVVTTQRHVVKDCNTRFKQIGTHCVAEELAHDSFGTDAVRPPPLCRRPHPPPHHLPCRAVLGFAVGWRPQRAPAQARQGHMGRSLQ